MLPRTMLYNTVIQCYSIIHNNNLVESRDLKTTTIPLKKTSIQIHLNNLKKKDPSEILKTYTFRKQQIWFH